MSSRRSARQLLVAVILGVLVGGGLMAVTPAGAEVSSAVATNWKKIWKKNLKPLADKRYYTKKKSTEVFESKGSGYTKGESDAKYAGAGSSFTKAESDARYRPTALIQGVSIQDLNATAASQSAGAAISFGVTLSAAPTVHYIPLGAPNPAGCAGSSAAPNPSAGHLCVYETYSSNNAANVIGTVSGVSNQATTTGAVLFAQSAAAGQMVVTTVWAVRPLAVSANPRTRTIPRTGDLFD
jgi:hypothetical protein